MALKRIQRISLAELHQEDQRSVQTTARPLMSAPLPEQQPIILNSISEKRNPKSDFIKMSITVEPELFEAVQNLSRTRRKQKQEFTFSAIIRDALKAYLP